MSDEQRTTVARVTGEVCRGRALSIMHVGSTTTASSVEAAAMPRAEDSVREPVSAPRSATSLIRCPASTAAFTSRRRSTSESR